MNISHLGDATKGVNFGVHLLQRERGKEPLQPFASCLNFFQLDQPKKAASAAYTYFLAHSEDETSKKNVVYFRDGARVAEADFLDLEMLPYKV